MPIALAIPAWSELTEPVTAEVVLRNVANNKTVLPQAGDPFVIGFQLTDVVTKSPASNPDVTGWLRPLFPGQPSCRDAARNQRITQSLPRGDIGLSGKWIVALDSDNRLTVIDPAAGAGRDMIAIHRLAEPPSALHVDEVEKRVLLTLPQSGKVEVLTLPGLKPIGPQLKFGQPVDIEASGNDTWWTADAGSKSLLHINNTGVLMTVKLEGTPRRLIRTSPSQIGAVLEGSIVIVDDTSGQIQSTIPMPSGVEPVWSSHANAFLWSQPGGLAISTVYADAPLQPSQFFTSVRNSTLSLAPPGRFAFVWSADDARIEVIDLATSRQRAAGSFGQPVGEIAFGGGFAFVLLQDHATVVVADLATFETEGEIGWREVRTGLPPAVKQRRFPNVATLASDPSALLLHSNLNDGVALEIAAGETALAAPMHAYKLKSGSPRGIWSVNRGFNKVSQGYFEVIAKVDEPGDYELVVAGGIGSFVSCTPIKVAGTSTSPETSPGAALELGKESTLVSGGTSQIVVRVRNTATGRLMPLERGATFTVFSLTGSWRQTAVAHVSTGSALSASFNFPAAGLYPVIVSNIPGADESTFKPIILEVK